MAGSVHGAAEAPHVVEQAGDVLAGAGGSVTGGADLRVECRRLANAGVRRGDGEAAEQKSVGAGGVSVRERRGPGVFGWVEKGLEVNAIKCSASLVRMAGGPLFEATGF